MTALAWTDAEITRFSLRVGLFTRRGLSQADAEQFAERCVERDRDQDDRRGCIECSQQQRGHQCAATNSLALPQTILHRCPSFGWQVPRAS